MGCRFDGDFLKIELINIKLRLKDVLLHYSIALDIQIAIKLKFEIIVENLHCNDLFIWDKIDDICMKYHTIETSDDLLFA